ncbi:MAG: thioredoxin family protein [Candidatus Helarchaeota archaeon]
MVIQIKIIGPYPPCIRCHRVRRNLKSLQSTLEVPFDFEHIYAGDPEAKKYGKIVEAEIFAEKMGIDLNYKELFKKRDLKGIDKALAPYVNMAREKGILLTPVVIINDKIKTIGRVVSKQDLKQLIFEEAKINE